MPVIDQHWFSKYEANLEQLCICVADKGQNFYYNPYYLLQLNEFVNTAKA